MFYVSNITMSHTVSETFLELAECCFVCQPHNGPIGLMGRMNTQWELKSSACTLTLCTCNCSPPSISTTNQEHRQKRVYDNPKGKRRQSGGRCQANCWREGTNCVHSFYDPSFEQCFSAILVPLTIHSNK